MDGKRCACLVLLTSLAFGLGTSVPTAEEHASRLPTSDYLTLPEQKGQVNAVGFSQDGKILATGTGGSRHAGEVKFWDVATGKEKAIRFDHPGNAGIFGLALSADGKWLATASTTLVKRGDKFTAAGLLCLFDAATGKLKGERIEAEGIYAVRFSSDSTLLATCGSEGSVKLWAVPAVEEKSTVTVHADRAGALMFSGDGKMLASASDDGVIKVSDAAGGRLKFSLTGHQALVPIRGQRVRIQALAFSSDGALLASGDYWGNVIIWDVARKKQQRKLAMPNGDTVFCLDFAPDGKTLATGSGTTVRFWELATGKERARLEGHTNGVYSLSFSRDGRLLATGDAFRVRLWRAAKSEKRPDADKRP